MHTPEDRLIVVGGGLAGLAAATWLARGGAPVTLLERRAALGGRAETTVSDGYHFNMGPHALYRGGAAEAALRDLGVAWRGAAPPTGGALGRWRGEWVRFPASPLGLLRCEALDMAGRWALARVMTALPRVAVAPLARQSLQSWVEEHVAHAGARAVVLSLARLATYCDAPDQISAEVALGQLQRALRPGVAYLDGGWGRLVEGLERAALAAGVEIRVGAAAEAVRGAGALWEVRLGDGALSARGVVLATTLAAAAKLAPEGLLRARAARALPLRAACLDVGLRRLPAPSRSAAFGLDEPIYASVHSRVAALAPEGGAVVHVARYLPPGEGVGPHQREALEALLDGFQPGWRALVTEARYLGGALVSSDLDLAAEGGFAGRAPVTLAPGLFVAGDWVGRRGLLADAALASAQEAAQAALAHHGARAAA
jgi:phytoene dehydrogenase-like protein